jgi:chromosome segregation ATPase
MEMEYLNGKIQNYLGKINRIQDTNARNKKAITDNSKKLEDLEKEYKSLQKELGPAYEKEKLMQRIMGIVKKKQKTEEIIRKGADSKMNAMMIKIKGLQSELRGLKDNEEQISSQVLNTSKRVDLYQGKIRLSPILHGSTKTPEPRSFSVKPIFQTGIFRDIN